MEGAPPALFLDLLRNFSSLSSQGTSSIPQEESTQPTQPDFTKPAGDEGANDKDKNATAEHSEDEDTQPMEEVYIVFLLSSIYLALIQGRISLSGNCCWGRFI